MLRKKHSLPWGQSSLRKQPKNFSLEMLSPFSSHLFTHTHTHASAHPYTHTNLLLTLSPSNRQVVKRRRRTDPQRNREYDRRMWLMGAAKPLHFDLCLSDTNTHTHSQTPLISSVCRFPLIAFGSGHQVCYPTVRVFVCWCVAPDCLVLFVTNWASIKAVFKLIFPCLYETQTFPL